uniref:Uncharacterized protein n=1 Tax=mine drainage metagenome TaxID=410659 RepID=E6QIS9_9ZZZZ
MLRPTTKTFSCFSSLMINAERVSADNKGNVVFVLISFADAPIRRLGPEDRNQQIEVRGLD